MRVAPEPAGPGEVCRIGRLPLTLRVRFKIAQVTLRNGDAYIDASYTVGEMELRIQQIREKMLTEGCIDKHRRLPQLVDNLY